MHFDSPGRTYGTSVEKMIQKNSSVPVGPADLQGSCQMARPSVITLRQVGSSLKHNVINLRRPAGKLRCSRDQLKVNLAVANGVSKAIQKIRHRQAFAESKT